MKYLVFLLAAIGCTSIANAQGLTRNDMVGTYHITSITQSGITVYANQKADSAVYQNMQKLRKDKPKYTADDSLKITVQVNMIQPMVDDFSKNTFDFRNDDTLVVYSGKKVEDMVRWAFDDKKQVLVTNDKGKIEEFPAVLRDKKATISFTSKDYNDVPFTLEMTKD